jgi:hypothetical protein
VKTGGRGATPVARRAAAAPAADLRHERHRHAAGPGRAAAVPLGGGGEGREAVAAVNLI